MLETNIFYRTILSRRFSSDTQTGESILQILEYMISEPNINQNTKLTFELLREKVSDTVPDDDFISSVFYLTRREPNVKALRQVVEAWDEQAKAFVEITPHQFSESIADGMIIHPLTFEEMDADKYNEQVHTYFLPTEEFIQSLGVDATA